MSTLYGTGEVDEAKLEKVLREVMNLRPRGIREHLQLNKPIYARTSAYGHFGRVPEADGGFSWERTDLADVIRFGDRAERREACRQGTSSWLSGADEDPPRAST